MTIEELSNLSNEELRVRRAELCGWKPETRKVYAGEANVKGWGLNQHLSLGHRDRQFTTSPASFPNYPADLNAMHEAVEGLQTSDWWEYHEILCDMIEGWRGAVSATARQRCIAFIAVKQSA